MTNSPAGPPGSRDVPTSGPRAHRPRPHGPRPSAEPMSASRAPGPSASRASAARSSLRRRAAVAAAGAAALAGLAAAAPPASAQTVRPQAAAATPASAQAAPPQAATAPRAADFADCPPLPAGADPARWRCEVHTAAPEVTMGGLHVTLAPITMTHAEGPMPDGSDGQVWGAMHSAPTAVPGGLTGTPAGDRVRPLELAVQPEYGGRSDFYTGQFSLRFRLAGALLPRGCTIGAGTPVDFRLTRSGPSVRISDDPPVIAFSAYDDTFSVPAPEGCGPLTPLLDRRLRLPSPGGNLMTYDATYTYRMYDRLTAES